MTPVRISLGATELAAGAPGFILPLAEAAWVMGAVDGRPTTQGPGISEAARCRDLRVTSEDSGGWAGAGNGLCPRELGMGSKPCSLSSAAAENHTRASSSLAHHTRCTRTLAPIPPPSLSMPAHPPPPSLYSLCAPEAPPHHSLSVPPLPPSLSLSAYLRPPPHHSLSVPPFPPSLSLSAYLRPPSRAEDTARAVEGVGCHPLLPALPAILAAPSWPPSLGDAAGKANMSLLLATAPVAAANAW